MPKISVISAIYNPGLRLRPMLDSLVNQTLKDIEIILIDNGSTDGSKEILTEYANNNSNFLITFRDQSNDYCGLKKAFDLGRSQATGDYIIFIDHDDEVVHDGLEKLYTASEGIADVVKGAAFYRMEKEEDSYIHYPISASEKILDWSKLDFNSLTVHFLHAPELWTMLLRRDFQKDIEFGDYFYNDTDFVFKVKLLAKDFRYITDVVYNWNVYTGSTSHGKHYFNYYDALRIFDNLEKFIKINQINPKIWEIFALLRLGTYQWFTTVIDPNDLEDYFKYAGKDLQGEYPIKTKYLNKQQLEFYLRLINIE